MNPAKVTLSPKELELVTDPGWILTKNAIIQKVYDLFGGLSIAYREAIDTCLSADRDTILLRSPKISKGEQYEGLPWVMLDYPRHYQANDSFGIRTFFWWGNCFSISIQLSGKFQQRYAASLQNHFDNNDTHDWLTGIGNDPWQHHFREDNYQPLNEESKRDFANTPFIKLTKVFPLTAWEHMDSLLEKSFREILQMLG